MNPAAFVEQVEQGEKSDAQKGDAASKDSKLYKRDWCELSRSRLQWEADKKVAASERAKSKRALKQQQEEAASLDSGLHALMKDHILSCTASLYLFARSFAQHSCILPGTSSSEGGSRGCVTAPTSLHQVRAFRRSQRGSGFQDGGQG
jgi:hypothetical protein